MKKQLALISAGTILTAMILLAVSCKKSSTNNSEIADEQTATTLAGGATGTESIYDDTFDVVTQSSEQTGVSNVSFAGSGTPGITTLASLSYTAVSCAQISILPKDTTTFPKTMTIDYGSGCTSSNGITRKGSLSVTLSGKLRKPGTVISVTFNNYSVNGYLLAGSYSFTPVTGSNGGLNYNITISNANITTPTGVIYTYSGTETFTQTAGIGTTTITDDAFSITGNFNYAGNGNSISGTITSPMVRTADCPNITTGTIKFTYKSLSGVLDFGSGTCDNIATMTVGRTTTSITLPR